MNTKQKEATYEQIEQILMRKDPSDTVRFCKSVGLYANKHFIENRPGTITYVLTMMVAVGKIRIEQIENF